jgi:hypothetical protein
LFTTGRPAYTPDLDTPSGVSNFEQIFQTYVTVSSGGETVNCPTIFWTASFAAFIAPNGQRTWAATAKVYNQPTAVP